MDNIPPLPPLEPLPKWISLRPIPVRPESVFVYVVAGSNKDNYLVIHEDAIWKYHFDQDEWSKIFDQPNIYNYVCCSAALNSNGTQLFIVETCERLVKIQLSDNAVNIMNHDVFVGIHARSIIINNTLNVIGGHVDNLHWKWDEKNKHFTKVSGLYNNKSLYGFGFVYHKRTNRCLLFGGGPYNIPISCTDDILEFNIEEQTWSKLKVKLPKPLHECGCTLAFHGQYVLIFGGSCPSWRWTRSDKYALSDIIYIYDIKNKTIKESQTKCPTKGMYSAITICDDLRDEKTVFGYTRREWNISNIDDHYFPPFYILNIIKAYFYTEFIYLYNRNNNQQNDRHYKINTFDII